jgi:abequosyltransferase
MVSNRKLLSICIPAYNRVRHLAPLLDSILAQDFRDFEVVICEDQSPQREQIAAVVRTYQARYPLLIRYFENSTNLGYDANIRNLVEKATGAFCFFMGNDDIMCEGAMKGVAGLIDRHPNVGLIVKSYAWFNETPDKVDQEVRYFTEETDLGSGPAAIRFAFRRSGVISGYIVHRDGAHEAATDKFARVLLTRSAVCTPQVLVLCRNGEPPEFGASAREQGKYVPGQYTPQARINMIAGAMSIIGELRQTHGVDVVEEVTRDYANYFYPYIKDQLTLPVKEYWKLYRQFGRMGFGKYPLFHVHFIVGYLLGERRLNGITRMIRKRLGRSPRL